MRQSVKGNSVSVYSMLHIHEGNKLGDILKQSTD